MRHLTRPCPRFGLLAAALLAAVFTPLAACGAERPLARIAVISNTYITALDGPQIVDENGRVRDFLAQTGPDSLKRAVALVNRLSPDALVVLGSGTWTGTEPDCRRLASFLDGVKTRVLLTPGHRDRVADGGSLAPLRAALGDLLTGDTVQMVNDVALAFADVDHDPDGASRRLQQQLSEASDACGVLLLAHSLQPPASRPLLNDKHEQFWKLVDRQRIAVRIDASRYGQRVNYENTLPSWTVGSTAWSMRGSVSLIQVYADRVELSEVREPGAPAFTLRVPNPVAAERLPAAAEDPFGCPSYSQDLQQRPEFTFALVSDPQFDRERNRQLLIDKAEAAIAELNRLKPAMVFVAGDLVNNNLPEEWGILRRVFSQLEPPWHSAPGNHDVLFNYDFVESSYAQAPARRPDYAALVAKAVAEAEAKGYRGPTALYERYTGSKPRQTIEHGRSAFVTVPFLTTRADAEQVQFLRRQLERTRDKRHVFVLAHYPALPAFGNNLQPQLGGTEVLSLLSEHRVTAYLFGHRHRNGFAMHDRTAHVLSDNMGTIHLLHVFADRVVVGRKRVGSPLYPRLTISAPR